MALRLMCVTAHPDDESAGFGGALLLAHERGAETTVICLTEGLAASHRGQTSTDAELAAVRRAEMAEACNLLGVTQYEVWDYPDSALMETGFAEMTTRLVERMRQFRPHVVLTFGGDGGPNLHRDHATASFAATAAFHQSGRSNFAADQLKRGLALWAPQKLYYASTLYTVSRFAEEAALAPRVPTSLVLELGAYKEVKVRALEAHRSQAVLSRVGENFDKYGDQEHYLLVSARDPERFPHETDMFQGVVEA